MEEITYNQEEKLNKFEFLNVENLGLKYIRNKEIIEKKVYPKVSSMIYTYLNKSDNEFNKFKELKFKVEIPKDIMPSLLNGTAEFMKDAEGKTLPCIISSENKRIVRQIRLKILETNSADEISKTQLDNFNNTAFYSIMQKAIEELQEIKDLARENNKLLKQNAYNKIESGIWQYLKAKNDKMEEVKKQTLVNARQTLMDAIVELKNRIKESKKYFESALKTNLIIRELFYKKYSLPKLDEKSYEFDNDIEYLYNGLNCWVKINLELGNSDIFSDNIFKEIQEDIAEIESNNLEILMPENARRQEIYYSIINLNHLFMLEDKETEKIVIDILLKGGE